MFVSKMKNNYRGKTTLVCNSFCLVFLGGFFIIIISSMRRVHRSLSPKQYNLLQTTKQQRQTARHYNNSESLTQSSVVLDWRLCLDHLNVQHLN